MEGPVGTEASSRESLSADLELLHRLPPRAIIHSRRTPHEADDGCLACGPSALTIVKKKKKAFSFYFFEQMEDHWKSYC